MLEKNFFLSLCDNNLKWLPDNVGTVLRGLNSCLCIIYGNLFNIYKIFFYFNQLISD